MPTFEMVGLLNHEVREAKERVKVALKNTGIEIPPKITVSISPAVEKEGAAYDLPVAVGMLSFTGILLLAERIQDTIDCGRAGTGWNREVCERNPCPIVCERQAGRA